VGVWGFEFALALKCIEVFKVQNIENCLVCEVTIIGLSPVRNISDLFNDPAVYVIGAGIKSER
jgi:hypothetical protein